MTNYLRDAIPPVLWRAASKLRRHATHRQARSDNAFPYGNEQPAAFYDATYAAAEHWRRHYTQSRYYCLWTVIADRLSRARLEKVLDIGCGPGQMGCLLRDRGVKGYTGLDFSSARVSRARAICPEYEFVVEDAFATDLLATYDYDCVLMLEFLEHVERDLELMQRVRPGTLILGTVPNFPASGHVRWFETAVDVKARYGSVLKEMSVTKILADDRGMAFFIFDGTR